MNWQEKLIRSVGRAYQKHSCPEISEPDEYEHGKFWLGIHKANIEHPGSVITDSGLTVDEIAEILSERKKAELTKHQNDSLEKNLNFIFEKIREAQAEIHGADAGRSTSQKYAEALGILGLVFQENDPEKKAKEKRSAAVRLNAIYKDFCILRLGGLTRLSSTGQIVVVESHDYQQAFDIIKASYRLTTWEALVKQFKRYKIEYSKNPKHPLVTTENKGKCFITPVEQLYFEDGEYKVVYKDGAEVTTSDWSSFNHPSAETYSGTVLPDEFKHL